MQKQSLTCADARHLAHLAVGDDLLSDEESRLAEHLHQCSDCRTYHAGMVDAMHIIEQVRDDFQTEPPTKSLWPAMADQLKVRQARLISAPESKRFNVAVAALCVCSLMLALVTAVQNLPNQGVQLVGDYSVIPAMNVSSTSRPQPGQTNQQVANRLVEVELQDGSRALIDRVTGQFVPTVIRSNDENLNF